MHSFASASAFRSSLPATLVRMNSSKCVVVVWREDQTAAARPARRPVRPVIPPFPSAHNSACGILLVTKVARPDSCYRTAALYSALYCTVLLLAEPPLAIGGVSFRQSSWRKVKMYCEISKHGYPCASFLVIQNSRQSFFYQFFAGKSEKKIVHICKINCFKKIYYSC